MIELGWRTPLFFGAAIVACTVASGCSRPGGDAGPSAGGESAGEAGATETAAGEAATVTTLLDLADEPWDGPPAARAFDPGLALLDVRAALRMMQTEEPCAIPVSRDVLIVGGAPERVVTTGHAHATPERVIVLRPDDPSEGRAVRTGTFWTDAGQIEHACREDLCDACGSVSCRTYTWSDDGRAAGLTLRTPGSEDREQRVVYGDDGTVRIVEVGADGAEVELSSGVLADGRLTHITASGVQLAVRYNEGGYPTEVVRDGGVVVTAIEWDEQGRVATLRMQGHAEGFRYLEEWRYTCDSPSALVAPRALTDEEAGLLAEADVDGASLCVTESPLFDTRFVHACDTRADDEGAVVGVVRGGAYTPREACASVAADVYAERRAAGGNTRGRAQVAANAVRFTCLGGRRPASIETVEYVHVIRGSVDGEAWAFANEGGVVPVPESMPE